MLLLIFLTSVCFHWMPTEEVDRYSRVTGVWNWAQRQKTWGGSSRVIWDQILVVTPAGLELHVRAGWRGAGGQAAGFRQSPDFLAGTMDADYKSAQAVSDSVALRSKDQGCLGCLTQTLCSLQMQNSTAGQTPTVQKSWNIILTFMSQNPTVQGFPFLKNKFFCSAST